MRFHALPIVCLTALALPLSSGCKGRGQLVLGFATDLPATGSLDEVAMSVTRRGQTTPIITHSWAISGVPAKNYRLPGSFNLYADPGASPVFDVDVKGLLGGKVVVDRRSSLGIVDDQELFIRLGLTATCQQLGCPSTLTCIEGVCRTPAVDLRTLPAYRRDLVDEPDCSSGTVFIDTSTHQPLVTSGTSCASGHVCVEGTCLVDPATLSSSDPKPFIGGASELFGQASDKFFSVGELDAARFGATSTLLDDGTVLVVGGGDSAALDGTAHAVPGAAIYDPTTASYHRASDPPVAMLGHTATRLPSGLILFVGSADGEPAAFVYDQSKQAFAAAPAPSAARFFHTATLLTSGKVLVAGGASAIGSTGFTLPATAEVFDPSANAWRTTVGAPATPRVFHASAAPSNGTVLLLGGMNSDGEPLADVEIYDPSTDKFTPASAPLAQPRALTTATVLSDDAILLVGGLKLSAGDASLTAELYTPEATITATYAAPGRLAASAVSLGNDRVLFVGGASTYLASGLVAAGGAVLFDRSQAPPFVPLPSPVRARSLAFATALAPGGDVLIGGGVISDEVGDGGESSDLRPPADFSIACTPGQLGACGTGMRCAIIAVVAWGPRLVAPVTTACVTNGAVAPNAPCTPATSTQADNCGEAYFCVDTVGTGTPTCQHLCTSDMNCVGDMGQQGLCGLSLDGLQSQGVGLCFDQCDPVEDICPSTDGMNSNCRYTLHPAMGGGLDAQGMCRAGGDLPLGASCARNSYLTDCGGELICVAGVCDTQCNAQASCPQAGPPNTCTLLPMAMLQPDDIVNGYCTTTTSDAGVGIDMSTPP